MRYLILHSSPCCLVYHQQAHWVRRYPISSASKTTLLYNSWHLNVGRNPLIGNKITLTVNCSSVLPSLGKIRSSTIFVILYDSYTKTIVFSVQYTFICKVRLIIEIIGITNDIPGKQLYTELQRPQEYTDMQRICSRDVQSKSCFFTFITHSLWHSLMK